MNTSHVDKLQDAFNQCWADFVGSETSAWAWDVAHLPEIVCWWEYHNLLMALIGG